MDTLAHLKHLSKRNITKRRKVAELESDHLVQHRQNLWLALDHFNEPLDPELFQMLRRYFTPPAHLTVPDLVTRSRITAIPPSLVQAVGAESSSDTTLDAISQLFNYTQRAARWLRQALQDLGWHGGENFTGYEPMAGASNYHEVLAATLETYKMACKQTLRMLEQLGSAPAAPPPAAAAFSTA